MNRPVKMSLLMRPAVGLLRLLTSPLFAAGAPKVPRAVAALATVPHRAAPLSGPFSWTADYQYDGSGNITDISAQTFRYDLNGRLTRATVESSDPTQLVQQDFAYDAYGNLQTKSSGIASPLYLNPLAASNQLGSFSAQYDEAGNLKSYRTPSTGVVVTYTWDGLGAMMTESRNGPSAPEVIHAYTADDERIWTRNVTAGTASLTVRDLSGQVLRRFDGTSSTGGYSFTVTRDYVYRNGQMLMARRGDGTMEHFSLDHLGTPRVITDGSHIKIGYHVYGAFGDPMGEGAQDGDPKKYAGHERDAGLDSDNSALDYMHARYYSSLLSRFLSVDGGAADPHVPGKWNRYAYVGSNPLARVDRDGKDWYLVLETARGGGVWHEAIVWIDTRGYGRTYEHPAHHSEYVGDYSGSYGPKNHLTPTRFRNLGPAFDPAIRRATTDVGGDDKYQTGRLQCTNYCAYLAGDRVFDGRSLLGNWLFDLPPHPDLLDRDNDPDYLAGVLVDGVMYPADIAAGVGADSVDVHASGRRAEFAPGFHNYLTTDPGVSLFCVDGICR